MPKLSAKTHIALGQSFLVVTLLLAAMVLGLIPDRHGAIREGRAALAETVAFNGSALLTQSQIQRLEMNLAVLVERHPDLLSAAVRFAAGSSSTPMAPPARVQPFRSR